MKVKHEFLKFKLLYIWFLRQFQSRVFGSVMKFDLICDIFSSLKFVCGSNFLICLSSDSHERGLCEASRKTFFLLVGSSWFWDELKRKTASRWKTGGWKSSRDLKDAQWLKLTSWNWSVCFVSADATNAAGWRCDWTTDSEQFIHEIVTRPNDETQRSKFKHWKHLSHLKKRTDELDSFIQQQNRTKITNK